MYKIMSLKANCTILIKKRKNITEQGTTNSKYETEKMQQLDYNSHISGLLQRTLLLSQIRMRASIHLAFRSVWQAPTQRENNNLVFSHVKGAFVKNFFSRFWCQETHEIYSHWLTAGSIPITWKQITSSFTKNSGKTSITNRFVAKIC